LKLPEETVGVLSPVHSDEPVSVARWDTVGLAFTGAFCGFVVGSAHEIGEVLLLYLEDMESFAQIGAEIAAATLSGALLFAAVSVLRNHLRAGS
jgi:hypothetical protein